MANKWIEKVVDVIAVIAIDAVAIVATRRIFDAVWKLISIDNFVPLLLRLLSFGTT